MKSEGERSPAGTEKSLAEEKLERTHQAGEEQRSTAERARPLGEWQRGSKRRRVGVERLELIKVWLLSFFSPSLSVSVAAAGCAEAVKTELREQASGHSSASDVESDCDSPAEVKGGGSSSGGGNRKPQSSRSCVTCLLFRCSAAEGVVVLF